MDTMYVLQKSNKHWTKRLAAALALLILTTVIAACSSGGPSDSPVATISTPTADTSVAPTTGTTAGPIATATTPPPTAQPTTPPAVQPTTPPAVQPTTPPPTPKPPVPTPAPTQPPTHPTGNTLMVWIQVTDSCKQALPGGTFSVSGPGISTTTAPTGGSGTFSLVSSSCPIPHGSCSVSGGVGCTSVALPIPSSGSATYKVTIAKTASPEGSNLSYAVCEGGSACPHGPEVATVQVSSNGSASATTLNFFPDGVSITYGPFNTSQGDPIMFHEFGIGNGSIQCDGDHDADDFLTGTPGQHCDSDGPHA